MGQPTVTNRSPCDGPAESTHLTLHIPQHLLMYPGGCVLRVSGDRHSCLDQVGGSGILGNALKSQWLLSDAQVSNMVIEGPQTGGKGYRTNHHVRFGASVTEAS